MKNYHKFFIGSLALLISISSVYSQDNQDVLVMDEIEVEAILDPPVIIDRTRSTTKFNLEEIESRQADNIFEIIDDIPGVSLSGGPRSNGIDINIRGFGNNEDVIYKIDGAVKNFEKYRFGGTFIEPELLKSIEVTRGAATTTLGSGALGGVVEMETKDASDFLKPGQTFGVSTKIGHRFNNDEQITSLTLFSAPIENLDLLLNITDRESNNYELTGKRVGADGNDLEVSDTVPSSGLAKLEYYVNDAITWGMTFTRYLQSGIEALDTSTTSTLGFGSVDRDSDDKTYATKLLINPDSDLVDFKFTLALTDTEVSEVAVGDGFQVEGTTTEFEYKIWALEAKNTSLVDLGDMEHAITVGLDGEYSDRDTLRINPLTGSIPNGVDAQPSGINQKFGVYLVDEIKIGNFSVTPGLRWDYNHSRVTFDEGFGNTVDDLKLANQDNSESFDIVLPSLSLAYRVGKSPVTLFYNYWEQYRPPKIDEYFTQGGFGRCPQLGSGQIGIDPQDVSGVCGDQYQPEKSDNYDVGMLVEKNGLWGNDRLLAKFTYFDTKVNNLLEFLNNDGSDRTSQSGSEKIHGVELELNYARENVSLNLAYSQIDGKREGFYLNETTQTPAKGNNAAFKQTRPIYSIPGDTLSLTTKYSVPKYNLELGWRGQYIDDRLGLDTEVNPIDPPAVRFDDYFIQDVWANWRPLTNTKWKNSVLRFGVDNVGNKRHRVNNETGVGNFGVARNVKLTFTVDF